MAPRQDVFEIEVRDDGIAVLTIDLPGERQNILKAAFIDQFDEIFDRLEKDERVTGAVFISGKPGSFIAGADIRMLNACRSVEEAVDLSRTGQRIFGRIETFKAPVVAAIDGVCLGGGLELALACRGRVCSESDKTVVGLPEVKLGLLPGSGGSQRLPRLVGIPTALDLMLTGKTRRPAQARKIGLVDEVVPKPILLEAAVELVRKLRQGKTGKKAGFLESLTEFALEKNPLGRKLTFDKAREQMLEKTKGNYPAPKRIIECVEIGASQGMEKGLEAEAKYFGELAVSPEARQLMNIYFATQAMKKDTGVADDSVKPREVKKMGVLGAGLMGAGIAYVSAAKAGVPVRLKDKEAESLAKGLKYIDERIQQQRRRGSIDKVEAGLQRCRVTPTLDFSGFRGADLVIEAVFEDIEIKHRMIRDVEAHCRQDVVFASNTSSIPIHRLAEAAERPEQIVGMHYFSPVEKMPLLEVIAADKTAPEAVATAVAFGKRQGKTVIVVKDGAGFYVNRILAPYLNEANQILYEGVAIDHIDEALVQFGFPLGPLNLLDEVGIDIIVKVAPILFEAFGERMKPMESAKKMLDAGRLGKKSGRGFYRYEEDKQGKKKKQGVDESIYGLLGVKARLPMDREEIAERCVLPMVNEAARCCAEGVIRQPRDGDIGAVFGIGFPPFRGGPLRYADSLGARTVVEKLEGYRDRLGERFEPADILKRMAEKDQRFYEE